MRLKSHLAVTRAIIGVVIPILTVGCTYAAIAGEESKLRIADSRIQMLGITIAAIVGIGLWVRFVRESNELPGHRAIAPLTDQIRQDPTNVQAYVDRALAKIDLFPNGALRDLKRAVKIEPNHVEAHFHRGMAYMKLRKYDKAIADFERTLSFTEDEEMRYLAIYNRGVTYLSWKRYVPALSDHLEALKFKPDDTDVLYNIGLIHIRQYQLENALIHFHKYLDAADPPYDDWGMLRKMGKAQRFIEKIEKRLGIDTQNTPRSRVTRAIRYMDRKKFDDALRELDAALAIDPDYAEAHFGRGYIAQLQGRNDEALIHYDRVLALTQVKELIYNLYITRAKIYPLVHAPDLAIADLEKAAEVLPDEAYTFFCLAEHHEKQGHYDTALTYYEQFSVATKGDRGYNSREIEKRIKRIKKQLRS